MTGRELVQLLHSARCRFHVIGTMENGIIAALDLEGRVFTVVDGRVINRVNIPAITQPTHNVFYPNPGGDVLWPAPEGTTLGYEYATGNWRVPPSITHARWEVISNGKDHATITAPVDLINNRQTGFPCEFKREIEIQTNGNRLVANITETIKYLGKERIVQGDFLLVPWSLCQFNSEKTGKVVIPVSERDSVWDIYEPSQQQQTLNGHRMIVDIHAPKRFQLALGKEVEWIEYVVDGVFRVRRRVEKPNPTQQHIDISDVSPLIAPSNRGVKLSIYCDPTGFMEMEACGTCPDTLEPDTEISMNVQTEYFVATPSCPLQTEP